MGWPKGKLRATAPVGATFNRLTVLGRDPSPGVRPKWLCRCDCGADVSVIACDVKSGHTRSCGCYDADRKRTDTVRHGYARTKTYNCWANMISRCTNQNRHDWMNYGGRGIAVCERWRDFVNFLADMGEKPANLSIDRIDVNGNYEPENCRWATASQQRMNQRAAAAIGGCRE